MMPDAILAWSGGGAQSSVPEPTIEDAGKFLRVDASGTYVLETIPNAEEATF